MWILLALFIAFLIWPGSLILFSYVSETKKLHGHTAKYCKNKKCPHLEYIRRKATKGYYVYEYRCKCEACKMDGSYDIYMNNKNQSYNDKFDELLKSFENETTFNNFIESENNYSFFYELNEDDAVELIIKNKKKNKEVKLLLEKIINSSCISSIISNLISINDRNIDNYVLFIIDSLNQNDKIIIQHNIEDYIIDSLKKLNFCLAEKMCEYNNKSMSSSFVKKLLKLFTKYSKENKEQLDDFLNNSGINFSIDYEIYDSLGKDKSDVLMFFKKYVSEYCVKKSVENAFANDSVSELEIISVMEENLNCFIKKYPQIVFVSLKNNKKEILNWLKEKNINLDIKNEEGITPLMYAVVHKNNDLFDWLLKCNIDINEVDKYGDTVLSYLCHLGRFKMAKELHDNYGAKLFVEANENSYSTDTKLFLEEKLYESFRQNKKELMPPIPCSYYVLKNSIKSKKY